MPKPTTHGCLETFENYIENSDFDEEQHRQNKPKFCFKSAFPGANRAVTAVFLLPNNPAELCRSPLGLEASRFSQVQAAKRDLPTSVNLSRESKITQHNSNSIKRGKRETEGKRGEGKEWNSCRTVPPWHLIREPDEGSNLSP